MGVLLLLLLSIAAAVDFNEVYRTKHNLYKNHRELYLTDDFFVFCFSCHLPNLAEAIFTAYGSGVRDAQKKGIYPASVACLTCHDGFVAPDISPFTPGHHPIFVKYEPSPFHLRDLNTPLPGWIGAKTLKELLERYDYTLQCAVCHEPHVSTKDFLRVQHEQTHFCTACHDK
ncbi:MAG: hypothetical protein GXO03_02570 [Aquificae bacterium]|nr:hypothetical protein [Aquificota bacterium]